MRTLDSLKPGAAARIVAMLLSVNLLWSCSSSSSSPEDTRTSLARPATESAPAAEGNPTQEEARAELFALGQKSVTATFRVELRHSQAHQTITWYQEGERLRLDLRDPGTDGKGRERIYIVDGSTYFSCREPGVCAEDTTDLFDYGSQQEELEALGSVLLFGFQSFGDGVVDEDVTRYTEDIAGMSGTCFILFRGDDYEQDVCFAQDGIPLRLRFAYGGAPASGWEAISGSRSVDDTAFLPPYPLEDGVMH